MGEKEFASEIANAFAKGYNVGAETEKQIADAKEKYSVDAREILIMCYQELTYITMSAQRDTEFGKGARKSLDRIICALYQKFSYATALSHEEYINLAEKLKQSCYIWSDGNLKKEEK